MVLATTIPIRVPTVFRIRSVTEGCRRVEKSCSTSVSRDTPDPIRITALGLHPKRAQMNPSGTKARMLRMIPRGEPSVNGTNDTFSNDGRSLNERRGEPTYAHSAAQVTRASFMESVYER